MVINVTAHWKGEEMCDHRKTALFTCTKKDCQRTILLLEVLHSGKASAKLILPNDENRTFSLQRTISVDAKNLNLRIKYSDNEDEESEDLQLKGKIINKNYHVWSLRIHLDTFVRVKSLLANSFGSIINSLVSLARDPDHPVNKLAHSSFHMTLYDYFRHLRGQGNDLIRVSWTSLKDSLKSLKPFFETPLTLVWNIASVGTMKKYHTIEEESAPEKKIEQVEERYERVAGNFSLISQRVEYFEKKLLACENAASESKFVPAAPVSVPASPVSVKLYTYDGKTNWEVYRIQFGIISEANRWTEEVKACQLVASLRREAAEILQTLNDTELLNLNSL
ncbi:apolipoprotein B-100 [Trichonephila clavipes]|nr:apolipoprotein B-100 [Trichonephila clavipes]